MIHSASHSKTQHAEFSRPPMTSQSATGRGLEGVQVADSSIGKINGEVGELRYRGYLIKDLADASNFVETTYLLWHGELPTSAQLEELDAQLRSSRVPTEDTMAALRAAGVRQEPMDALRTCVSAMSPREVPGSDIDRQANLRRGCLLTARMPTLVAAYHRLRQGDEPLQPREDLDHAANFLYLLTGQDPDPEAARILDTCLVLHAEHGFNASTFAARVTAATLSDLYSATTSAIGTLKGPLHGGANTAVMNKLLELGDEEAVDPYVTAALAAGEKIMGFGHRVYKVVDPRALILKEFARRLGDLSGEPKWFRMSEQLERAIKAAKGLDVNVDFYSASTYHALGIPPDLFTCVFAISRVSGWVAHIMEQHANNRLIRPRSNWVGSGPRDYVPIDRRA